MSEGPEPTEVLTIFLILTIIGLFIFLIISMARCEEKKDCYKACKDNVECIKVCQQ